MVDYTQIPKSSSGPCVGDQLKGHQKTALSRILFADNDYASLKRSRMEEDKSISERDLKNHSAFPHLWSKIGHDKWNNRLTDEIALSQDRPLQGSGMVLADEMGMGKSVTVLAVIEATREAAVEWACTTDEEAENPSYRLPKRWDLNDIYIDTPPHSDTSLSPKKKRKIAQGSSRSLSSDSLNHETTSTDIPLRTKATLIVCPLSVLDVWIKMIEKHWEGGVDIGLPLKTSNLKSQRPIVSETLRIFLHRNNKMDVSPRKLCWTDIVLTTYETILRDHERDGLLYDLIFYRVVLDEGHRVCNISTGKFNAVNDLHRRHMLIVTGTPLQNYLSDMWSYAALLRLPCDLDQPDKFQKHIIDPILVPNFDKLDWRKLQTFVDIYFIRRVKDDNFWSKLPPKLIYVNWLDPTTSQTIMHDYRDDNPHQWALNTRQRQIAASSELVIRLDQVLMKAKDKSWEEMGYDEKRGSCKLDWLKQFVKEQRQKEKLVIFSQWTKMLDRVEELMHRLGYDCYRLQGKVPAEERPVIAAHFNEDESTRVCMLASIKAVSEGISLVGASICIFMDILWNPAPHDQAMDRLHRPGQTKTVTVYFPLTSETIEEQVWLRQKLKRGYYPRMFRDDNRRQSSSGNAHSGMNELVLSDSVFDELLLALPTRVYDSKDGEEED
ncbi:hypothetical protein CI109_103126 [Kwoniella shandongensis]|uniref:Uncharacterized protein n=1 Tax=Kwoniella shandongensis TaxID=1734106 RepID=A0A5M6C8I6_9TREE|nr:uncharacterized protein CI109_000318 [Kwoniella shandongensis]KAA5531476.1 hypothetical protein CI109_000318 [Kwoniella shandongensis]